MAKYSIIMPVYNSSKTLNASIRSIINQTYDNWELLAIDDGSTDDSLDILKKYAKKDPRISVIHQSNKGPGVARNIGIKQCKGEYIAFLDSDDYYDYDFLKIIEDNNNNNDLIFISTIYESKNNIKKYSDNLYQYNNYPKKELLKLQTMGIIPWGACSKVVKSNIVKKCNFSNLLVGEEAIYSFNVLNISESISFIQKPLYHYVHNNTGQHTKGGFDPWRLVVEKVKNHLMDNSLYDEYEKSINGLAIKSLSIAIYRYCCNYNYKEALPHMKKIYKEYKKSYDLNNYENRYMSNSTKIIIFCLKYHLYFLLYIASMIKNNNDKK